MNFVTTVNADEIYFYYLCSYAKHILLSNDELTELFVIPTNLNSSELILICEDCCNFFQKLFKSEGFLRRLKNVYYKHI